MPLNWIRFYFIAFFILITSGVFAQETSPVLGKIGDTALHISLDRASVLVLNAKDSIMQKFAHTKNEGSFSFTGFPKGKYILLITYPKYADYVERFTLDSSHRGHDFGLIRMTPKARLLEEVIVKAKRAAVKIKGDTTEFNAENFKVQPNARVEDLLKQLPGIQVDKDGKITAQGQAVTKVLVDGEEFFGDDPTLVTKNIRADMVDKVQLYDKKSDQASFTGIDDGKKDKTINIKLKADKKKGYFGKLDAGLGTDRHYEGQALFNKFRKKEKLSFYATGGNTGRTGLGWQDGQKYGSSDNLQFGDGFVYINNSNDEFEGFDGRYYGQGIPSAKTGGLHYDTKWKDDRQSINANFKSGAINLAGSSNTLSQNSLPAGTQITSLDQSFDKNLLRNKLDATYQVKFDTSTSLKVSTDGTLKTSDSHTAFHSTTSDGLGNTLNTNQRSIDNKVNTTLFNATAFLTHKFKKTGRTLSVTLSEALNNAEAKGYLKSTTLFHASGSRTDSTQRLDQYITSTNLSRIFNSKLSYTEPLSKAFALVLEYGFGYQNALSDKRSYNPGSSGLYTLQVDSLSNRYRLDEYSNRGGVFLHYKLKKLVYSFGSSASHVSFDERNEFNGHALKRQFLNWNPQGNIEYRFSQQKALSFRYEGITNQPTIDQIQPVVVNADPLNIIQGNPYLTPSFTSSLNVNFHSYKVLTSQYIGLYTHYAFTQNPIVGKFSTDSSGRTVNTYTNLSSRQVSNYYASLYFGRKINWAELNPGIELSMNGNSAYNISNNELNRTHSGTYAAAVTLSSYKEKKYDFNFSAGPNYTLSGASLQPLTNNNGAGFQVNGSFSIFLLSKFKIHSDGSFEYRAKTPTFNTDYHRTLVNASISRSFFKADDLRLTLAVNDLLNQNKGFDRNASGNYIRQNTYTTIRRYFMFSVTWDFNKAGSK